MPTVPIVSRAAISMLNRQLLADRLPRLSARHEQKSLSNAEFAASYFLIWQMAINGRRFASRKRRSLARPDADAWLDDLEREEDTQLRLSLVDWLDGHNFFGVSASAPTALLGWLRGGWPLRLLRNVPPPLDVLRMQAEGTRPVTLIADPERAQQPVLAKANGFAFLVHDLEHAYKFFHDGCLHAGQRALFRLVLRSEEAGIFAPYREDAAFARQLDYLISDMNTHPVHSLRYLGAVLIECVLRRESKAGGAALSPRGEAELLALVRHLATVWAFPRQTASALTRLLLGRGFAAADAEAVELAVVTSELGLNQSSSETPLRS